MDAKSWKKFQFITIVQSCAIANVVNKSLATDALSNRHLISATGMFITMDDAFYASERIPDELDATQAAHQFITFSLKLDGEGSGLPYWAARR